MAPAEPGPSFVCAQHDGLWHGRTGWVYPVSVDLNFSNRAVRTRMPGGVAGERSIQVRPYAD